MRRRTRKGFIGILVFGLFTATVPSGCDLFRDFTHMKPVEVVSYSPSEEVVTIEDPLTVRIRFSSEMATARTEDAFSFENDDRQFPGRFSWQDGKQVVVFEPDEPPESPGEYRFSVETTAEDVYGNSLRDSFLHEFTIGTDRTAPEVVESSPIQGERVSASRPTITVTFTEPMLRESLLAAFSLSPDVRGAYLFLSDDAVLEYALLEDVETDTEYTVEVSTEARDSSGNPLADTFSITFRTVDLEDAEVLSVVTTDTGETLANVDTVYLNNDLGLSFEKDTGFIVSFSRELSPSEAADAVSIDSGPSLTRSWDGDFTTVTVHPTEEWEWDEIYLLEVLDESFRFQINGADSAPPEVTRVNYTSDISVPAPTFVELVLGDSVSFPTTVDAAFDVYIMHAPAYTIDYTSFLDAFALTVTNGAITYDLYSVAVVDGSMTNPNPLPGANETVLRVYLGITDEGQPGVVTLTVEETLKDTGDNEAVDSFSISVNTS